MPAPITEKLRDEMFNQFCEHPSVYYVGKVCKVSATTARRYRDLDKWVERLAKIRLRAAKKVDTKIVDRRKKWAERGRLLTEVGTKKYVNPDGSINEKAVREQSPQAATQNIEKGIDIERKALLEPNRVKISFDELEELSIEELTKLYQEQKSKIENES